MPDEIGTTEKPYKGYVFRIGGPRPDGKVVQVWNGELVAHRTVSVDHAARWVDEHGAAMAAKIDGRDRG